MLLLLPAHQLPWNMAQKLQLYGTGFELRVSFGSNRVLVFCQSGMERYGLLPPLRNTCPPSHANPSPSPQKPHSRAAISHAFSYWCLPYGLTYADRMKKIHSSHDTLAKDWGITQVRISECCMFAIVAPNNACSWRKSKLLPRPLHLPKCLQLMFLLGNQVIRLVN